MKKGISIILLLLLVLLVGSVLFLPVTHRLQKSIYLQVNASALNLYLTQQSLQALQHNKLKAQPAVVQLLPSLENSFLFKVLLDIRSH